jgi:multidrug efflux pump
MTSAATVFGHLPLVLASGPGAAARNSIGMVLVTGMTVGTVFTLFVVPVFYSLIAAQHQPSPSQEEIERIELLTDGEGRSIGQTASAG